MGTWHGEPREHGGETVDTRQDHRLLSAIGADPQPAVPVSFQRSVIPRHLGEDMGAAGRRQASEGRQERDACVTMKDARDREFLKRRGREMEMEIQKNSGG